MTVINSAPMPLPRVRLGHATGQTAVTRHSPTVIPTARPNYLMPHAFAPSVLYGASNFQGQGLGRSARPGATRYMGRPTSPGWGMSQGRGGRMGAPPQVTARPMYLMPRAFAPSVLYGAYNLQAQGLGRYGRRVRLAGIERFAPSVLYGAYTIQAQGMGRYRPLNKAIRTRMGCCGCPPSRYGAYPVRRLGQDPISDYISGLSTDLSDIIPGITPTPGGGSVTISQPVKYPGPTGGTIPAGSYYVNSQGQGGVGGGDSGAPQTTPDKCAGTTGAAAFWCQTFGAPTAPAWVWGVGIGFAALFAYKVLK